MPLSAKIDAMQKHVDGNPFKIKGDVMHEKPKWTTIHGPFECTRCGYTTQMMDGMSKHDRTGCDPSRARFHETGKIEGKNDNDHE
jgi:hypothetical protein